MHDFLIDVADAAVRDAALQYDRLIAECQPNVVKGIQMQWKRRFDKASAMADFLYRERLKNHDFAVQLSKNLNAFAVPFFVGVSCHSRG